MVDVGSATSSTSATAVERYEALRRAALGEAEPPESRSGLNVLLRRGLAAWMRILRSVAPGAATGHGNARATVARSCLGKDWHADVAGVLASMALATAVAGATHE